MTERTARYLGASAILTILLLVALAACQAPSGPATNQPPSASFLATNTDGPAPLTVSFDASASTDPDGSIVAYSWNFGDGSSGSGVTAEHTYTDPGGYVAQLVVTDDRGATSSATVEISVSATIETGSLSGTISTGIAATAAGGRAVPAAALESGSATAQADVVPGELIVRFGSGPHAHSLTPLNVAGVRLDAVRPLALAGARLYRHPDLSRAATVALARELQARPDVLYAHPNYILQALATPNDEFYSFQWHYPAINLPAAWDITTGSPDIVVAVGDTGILYAGDGSTATHPDFVGKVLPGYDFISDPQMAGDGTGRDPDPYDIGDNPGGQSSYHGSHVAGTIAAATNNGVGVAGVDWQARIVAIRMLGIGGGSLVDIVEGTLWAAGFDIAGVPTNANPAHVINLSLGGAYACTPFEQEAFDRIASASPRNAVVVVAAGNENQNVSGFSPASCRNVITVGASEFRDHRAPYSNFGARIDVMAPGGDTSADRNGDGFPDGVLSVFKFDGPDGDFFYEFQNGTSMAAPHVAGVISLMKSIDPTLDLELALAILQATARPLTAAACERPTAGDCGAGLIDAAAALEMLQAGTVPTIGGGAVAFSPNPLDYGSAQEVLTIRLTNTGAAAVSWSIEAFTEHPDNPGTMEDGAVFLPDGAAGSGVISAGASASTALGIDRSRVTADGAYQFALLFDVDGTEQQLTVRFRTGATTAPDLRGPMIVAAFIEDGAGDFVLSGFQEGDSFFADYGFAVESGANFVIAWVDENDNLEIDAGDFIGIYPEVVPVTPGAHLSGIDFAIERVVEVGAALEFEFPGGSLVPYDDPRWRRLSEALIERR